MENSCFIVGVEPTIPFRPVALGGFRHGQWVRFDPSPFAPGAHESNGKAVGIMRKDNRIAVVAPDTGFDLERSWFDQQRNDVRTESVVLETFQVTGLEAAALEDIPRGRRPPV